MILAESAGAIGLIVGFLGRIGAFGILCVMLGAISVAHSEHFYMNRFGSQQGEGYEYLLLASAMALTVLIRGSGALSVDHALRPDSQRLLRYYPVRVVHHLHQLGTSEVDGLRPMARF